jgi:hypothetical protein
MSRMRSREPAPRSKTVINLGDAQDDLEAVGEVIVANDAARLRTFETA